MRVGEIPSMLTLWRSTDAHTRSGSGKSGAPSYMTMVAPLACAPTIDSGPMIQPMSVTQYQTSPGWMSVWYAHSEAIFTRNPPWTWTAPLGLPVVPLV